MERIAHGPICLYAVVPAGEAHAACRSIRGVRNIAGGPIAALVGQRKIEAVERAALQHDRIVSRVLEASSSVVPFRFGTDVRSDAELVEVLARNLETLSHHLGRFHGRVEMGLKVKLPCAAAHDRLHSVLDRVRLLAPGTDDRRELLLRVATGHVFEGCYLISRRAIGMFWSAVEEVRCALAGFPILGSGPWAAYSFCDFALRPCLAEQDGPAALQTEVRRRRESACAP